jgi:RNA polymerase sigma factor (TIGR02999 family)
VSTNRDESKESQSSQITVLLRQMQLGDLQAGEQAVALVYDELRRIAARELRHERSTHTLVTTALLNEAYIRLVGSSPIEIQSRGHFFAVASQQMRRILVDHARAKNAQRRGGGAIQISLDEIQAGQPGPGIDLLLLDEALRDLQAVEPRAAKVVELRYFGGYTDKQVVEVLHVSLATVRRDWEFARCWLFDRMSGGDQRARNTT